MTRATRDAPQSYATPEKLLETLTPYHQGDVQGHWSDDRMLMVQALTWNTPQSFHESAPEVCRETGRVIVSWVRLDNRPKLCASLGLTDNATLTDPQIILAGHLAWGKDCVDQFEGDFSFVIYEPVSGQAFCARDSIGVKPFYYYADENVFVAGSTAAIFPILNVLSIAPSRAWIARYLARVPPDITSSAYEGVMRLAPAHFMQVGRDESTTAHRYFAFQETSPVANHRDPKYLDDYRAAFHHATETRLRSAYLIGAESSGGLDSSSIVGHAVKHLPHDIMDFHCFSLCHLDQEPNYILLTAMHCGVRHNHIQTNAQLYENADAISRECRIMGYPAEHETTLMRAPILERCQQLGIRTLLSGYGGDEMVTSFAGALPAELYANRQFGALLREMRGNFLTRPLRFILHVWRLFRSEKSTAALEPHMKMLAGVSPLKQSVMDELEIVENFRSALADEQQTSSVNGKILRSPIFDPWRVARLEASALVAQSYGIEYRQPLFDRQLMRQYLRTPAIEKRHKNIGRYLHRRCADGTIPDAITWKQSKDMGGVVGEFEHRELPEYMQPGSIPEPLASLLDFNKLDQNRAGFSDAKEKKEVHQKPVGQLKSVWRATLVARWLSHSN